LPSHLNAENVGKHQDVLTRLLMHHGFTPSQTSGYTPSRLWQRVVTAVLQKHGKQPAKPVYRRYRKVVHIFMQHGLTPFGTTNYRIFW